MLMVFGRFVDKVLEAFRMQELQLLLFYFLQYTSLSFSISVFLRQNLVRSITPVTFEGFDNIL